VKINGLLSKVWMLQGSYFIYSFVAWYLVFLPSCFIMTCWPLRTCIFDGRYLPGLLALRNLEFDDWYLPGLLDFSCI